MSRIRFAVAVIAVLQALLATGCQQSVNEQLAAAQKAVNASNGDLPSVQRILDDILRRDFNEDSPAERSSRLQALLLRGQLFRQIGLQSAAETDFRTILEKLDATDENALIQLSMTLAERGDENSDDLNRAIRHGELAFGNGKNVIAKVATGMAHLKLARSLSAKLRRELLNTVSGGSSVMALLRRLPLAYSLSADHPVSISVDRELGALLDMRTNDIRARIGGEIQDIRKHYSDARKDLLYAIRAYGMADVYMLEYCLATLVDLRQFDDGLLIARTAMAAPAYWANPRIVETVASLYASAGRHHDAAKLVQEYVEKGPWPLPIHVKINALENAWKSKPYDELPLLIETLSSQLRRDPDSQILTKFIAYAKTFLLAESGGVDDAAIADEINKFVSAKDAQLTPIIPDASVRAARFYLKANRKQDAMRVLEFGYAADPLNVEVCALRAQVMLDLKQDPISVGRYARFAIAHDPENSEIYYPVLRSAAENLFERTGQTSARIVQDTILRGETLPRGFTEGWLYYVLAREFYESEHYPESASCAIETLTRDGDLTVANITLSLARAKMHQMDAARQAITKALGSLPKDPVLLREIAASGANAHDATLRLLSSSSEAEARMTLAKSLSHLGDHAAVDDDLRPLLGGADASPDANLLAAENYLNSISEKDAELQSLDPAKIEQYLVKIPPRSPANAGAEWVRLRVYSAKRDLDSLKQTIDRLRTTGKAIERAKIMELIRAASNHQRFGVAAELAPLFEIGGAPANGADLLTLAIVNLQVGGERNAMELLDRAVALGDSLDGSVLLALLLARTGDQNGVHDCLHQLRIDWGGIRAIDYRRAAVAAFAKAAISPEELDAVKLDPQQPLSILIGASIQAISKNIPNFDKQVESLPKESWVGETVKLCGSEVQFAFRCVQAFLLLSCEQGAPLALREIREMRAIHPDLTLLQLFEIEAESRLPHDPAAIRSRLIQCAATISKGDFVWSRAYDIAILDRADAAAANEILTKWISANPDSKAAKSAALRAEILKQIAGVNAADAASVAALEEALNLYIKSGASEYESLRVQCLVYTKIGRKITAIGVARKLFDLAAKDESMLTNLLPTICDAYKSALPDGRREAVEIARKMHRILPGNSEPIQLITTAQLTSGRYSEAAQEVLDFLRSNSLNTEIQEAEIEEIIREVAPHDPIAAAEIAKVSAGAEPGDWRRWNLFIDTQIAVGQTDLVRQSAEALCKIAPIPDIKTKLAKLLASPGASPAGALELLGYARPASGPASVPAPHLSLEHAVIAARALVTLNRADEAVELLEGAVGAVKDIPARPNISNIYEAALPEVFVKKENTAAVLELGGAYATRGRKGDYAKGYACALLASKQLPAGPDADHALEIAGLVDHMRILSLTPSEIRRATRDEEEKK